MKEKLLKLPDLKDAKDRAALLEECSDFSCLSTILSEYREKVKNNSDELLQDAYVSGAGMIKVKIYDTGDSILTMNIFGNSNTAGKIPENIHVHDFQAYSYVARGIIREQQFGFSKSSDIGRSTYGKLVAMMSRLSIEVKSTIILELEKLFFHSSETKISIQLRKMLLELDISIEALLCLFTVFNGVKDIDETGKVIGENFSRLGTYDITRQGQREIKEGEKYFLPDSAGHIIDSSDNTTTLFLTDKTFKTKGYPKTSNPELQRGHAKRFPFQQRGYESRGYSSYGISSHELIKIIHGEIDYILS